MREPHVVRAPSIKPASGLPAAHETHGEPRPGVSQPRLNEPRVAVDVDIPSDVSQIERVVSLVTDLCRDLSLPKRHYTLNIPVALSEALSNAIIRGNHEDPSKYVHLRATVSDVALVIDVTDEGSGFDMRDIAHDPTSPEDLQREDGRGLFLMRQLMDRVEQIHGPHHILRLTLNR